MQNRITDLFLTSPTVQTLEPASACGAFLCVPSGCAAAVPAGPWAGVSWLYQQAFNPAVAAQRPVSRLPQLLGSSN